jgi:flagellin
VSLLRINSNVAALNAQRHLRINSFNLSKSLQKLSSGFRINTAADGPADLIISEGLRAQIGGLKAAIRNTQESVNYVGIAEGALKEISNILVSMRALATHAANTGVVTSEQVDADQAEVDNMLDTINRINAVTRFAGESIFTGNLLTFHIGEGATLDDQVNLTIPLVSAGQLGRAPAPLRLRTIAGGQLNNLALSPALAIGIISAATGQIASIRGTLGAFSKNTLQTNINSLSVTLENVTATESFIRDTNMAEEASNFTRHQILVQAGISVLAQTNVVSQSVLQLLR